MENAALVLNDDDDEAEEDSGVTDIIEYARSIGISPEKEPELLWIAREGYNAPLPPGWKAIPTEDVDAYFFNEERQISSWEHPLDEQFRTMVRQEREISQKTQSNTALTPSNQKDTNKLSPIPENESEQETPDDMSTSSNSIDDASSMRTFSEDSRATPFQSREALIKQENVANSYHERGTAEEVDQEMRKLNIVPVVVEGPQRMNTHKLDDIKLNSPQRDLFENDRTEGVCASTMESHRQMLQRLDIQANEIIQRNWMEYNVMCSLSYANLIEINELM